MSVAIPPHVQTEVMEDVVYFLSIRLPATNYPQTVQWNSIEVVSIDDDVSVNLADRIEKAEVILWVDSFDKGDFEVVAY